MPVKLKRTKDRQDKARRDKTDTPVPDCRDKNGEGRGGGSKREQQDFVLASDPGKCLNSKTHNETQDSIPLSPST